MRAIVAHVGRNGGIDRIDREADRKGQSLGSGGWVVFRRCGDDDGDACSDGRDVRGIHGCHIDSTCHGESGVARVGIDIRFDAVDGDAGADPDFPPIGEAAGHRDDRSAIVRRNIEARPGQGRVGQIGGRIAIDRVVGHGTRDARAA